MEAVNLLLSKRDVIEFAEENHSIVVYEYLDEDTIKLFLIKRNVVAQRAMLCGRNSGN